MAGAVAGFGLIAFAHLAAQLLAGPVLGDASQALLMPALAVVVWLSYRPGRTRGGVLAALALSWVGDVLPKVVSQQASFLAMVGAFLLAQLIYVWLFSPWVRAAWQAAAGRRRLLAASAVYLPVVVVLTAMLVPNAGLLGPAVGLYAVTIGAMAVFSVALSPVIAAGAGLFVFSDALIGLAAFWPPYAVPGHGFWVMLTYIGAQAVLVLGLARVQPAAHPAGLPVSRGRPPGQ